MPLLSERKQQQSNEIRPNVEEAECLVSSGFNSFNKENSEGNLAMHFLAAENPDPRLVRFCLEKGTGVNHKDRNNQTVLLNLIRNLKEFSWLAWDIIDSINICLAAGADVFSSDGCLCPCAPSGCLSPSAFDMCFATNVVFRVRPHVVWTIEWMSLVEEYRGEKAAKKMVLSFLRRVLSDKHDITHVCCHRGHDLILDCPFWHKRYDPIPEEDALEIVDEENEFVNRLEEEMDRLASESYQQLKSRWSLAMKELVRRYINNTEKKHSEHDRIRRNINVRIDECRSKRKDQVLVPHIIFASPLIWANPASEAIAEYVFWLEHEYCRVQQRQSPENTQREEKEGWYERRVSWILEIMAAVKVETDAIVQDLKKMTIEESRTEKVDQDAIINHFLTSCSSYAPESGYEANLESMWL
ncbi:hypothetical protein AJ79_01131 [Helicocarpus griseus UAMH5409]|uniref:Uncharacterized protein n=1 Tax=Helicocarpus griseus UAMH5409 TaxID=1447875 RepID=A0A2B7Y8Z7_9EURO|nr:hypothetical protein AJ79_01131 [Helicocarpus griseus UAMH5409]